MKGYLVEFRIVKKSHDHRGLTVWVTHSDESYPHLNAANEKEAEAAALFYLESASEEVTATGTESVYLGNVKVECVTPVEFEAAVGVE
jgi:hypothetical protein